MVLWAVGCPTLLAMPIRRRVHNVFVDGQEAVIGGACGCPFVGGTAGTDQPITGDENVGYVNPLLYSAKVKTTFDDYCATGIIPRAQAGMRAPASAALMELR